MFSKSSLRPVQVQDKGEKIDGFFHRFVYIMAGSYSETKVLVELSNGRLRYFDPYLVQFSDRKKQKDSVDGID